MSDDLGLLQAAADPYVPPENKKETLPAKAEVKLTMSELAKLAREIAMNINDKETILSHWGIGEAQYTAIEQIPFFARALEANVIEWTSAANTETRLKIEALAYMEEGLPTLTAKMMQGNEDLAKRVEVAKILLKLGGIGEKSATAAAPGERFVINITLNKDEALRYEKDVTPIPVTIEQAKNATAPDSSL
jgi:hypothetical protein